MPWCKTTSTLLKLRWTDSVKNEVLDTVKEERKTLQTIKWKPTGSGKSYVVTAFWNTLYKEK